MEPEPHDNDTTCNSDNEGEVPLSSDLPSAKKKRGASVGPPQLPDGQTRFIATSEEGLPNEMDEDTKYLQSDIGLQVRDMLPVGYEKFSEIPSKHIAQVMKALKGTYVLKYVKGSWLEQKIKKAWRDKKHMLRKKYIKGKSLLEARAEIPTFVTKEDWLRFVEINTSPEFEVLSQHNKTNRRKLEMPYAARRHTLAQIRHKIAKEKNLASDSEVGRTETFIACHTLKNKKEQCPEKMNEMRTIMDEHPETRLTSTNDALAKALGKDTRGRTRGIGPGVSSSFLKNTNHMIDKIVDSQQQNTTNATEIENIKKRLNELAESMSKIVDSQRQNRTNVTLHRSPSSSAQSSLPRHPDISDIGKKCEVYGWGNVLAAYGEVIVVDPHTLVHNVEMGDGNYKLWIETAVDWEVRLYRGNSQVTIIDDVVGGYTVWPKMFLKFVD